MATTVPAQTSKDVRLIVYVALGLFAGAAYVAFDILSEARIGRGTLTGVLADAHAVIDHLAPLVVGALLGVSAHYFRLRRKLAAAEEAASRVEALRGRLLRVERDQAVWVLAAAMLHELNNPLHALGLLLDECAEAEGDEARRADLIARARSQSDRALSHLKTLRSLRTIGEPDFQAIALDQVIVALAEDVGSLTAERGLVVRVDCAGPVPANADPTYVRTILENLVDNSLQSLRAGGGCIRIRLEAEQGCAIVRVSDDGPPLDDEVRSTLFQPLRSTRAHGLGMGLPIARALARAMRGDLSLENADEKLFRLELPLGNPT